VVPLAWIAHAGGGVAVPKPGPGVVFNQGHALAPNFVSGHLFNEDEGDTINDYTGNGHDGTRASDGTPTPNEWWGRHTQEHDPAFVTGTTGGNSWVVVPDATEYDFAGDFSVVVGYAAVRLSLTAFDVLLGKATDNAQIDGFTFRTQSGGKVTLSGIATTKINAANDGDPTPPYNDDCYHQCVMTYDASELQIELYADNVNIASKTSVLGHTTNAIDLYLGRQPDAASPSNWEGHLFYLYIFDRVLTTTEISDLFDDPYSMWLPRVLLPAPMVTELKKRSPAVYPVLEMDLPGGTKRYAEQELSFRSAGQYQGKILSWSDITKSIAVTTNDLTRKEVSVTIDDADQEFAKLVSGGSGHQVENSVSRVKLVMDVGVTHTRFAGRLFSYRQGEPRRWELTFYPDDVPLENKFPILYLTENDWPAIHDSAAGEVAPIVYGKHSSVGHSDAGMVPTFYVDTRNRYYFVSTGRIKAIDQVYRAGVPLDPGVGVLTYLLIRGKHVSVIEFTSDQGDPKEFPITCDVQGIENVGDGSGSLITNPVTQVEHALENFVYGDYRSGLWLTSQAPIDASSFGAAATFATNEGYQGAMYIQESQDGRTFFDEWLRSWEMRAFWDDSGDIQLSVLDHSLANLYISNPWIRWEQHESSFDEDYNRQDIVDRLTGTYISDTVENKRIRALEIRDISIGEDVVDTLDMIYGPASLE
jgi:hypothetical protein